ncbi:hypothetical protein KP79_PYT07359 [Mizuhopecten yessoensis]|uniref:Uncharacterized protein n=1 Tax=Mizuhopecten yessoensis TaxID=6573 RepID=A0A210QHQ0_MIZYE|nr:hypothetical protein KP79_PYT07359 [Mizuhopecten yessoensis]
MGLANVTIALISVKLNYNHHHRQLMIQLLLQMQVLMRLSLLMSRSASGKKYVASEKQNQLRTKGTRKRKSTAGKGRQYKKGRLESSDFTVVTLNHKDLYQFVTGEQDRDRYNL